MSVESYLATMARMVQWAIRDINNLVARVDMNDPDAARDALQAEMPNLVIAWGEAAATVAAEYFEELIGEPAALADPIGVEAIESDIGWAVGPAFGSLNEDGSKTPPDPGGARRRVVDTFERRVHDQARNTIRENAESRPGVGWARILTGRENCAWCYVMASRGAVFESRETAQMRSGTDPLAFEAGKTHRRCDCEIVPIRDESDYPQGYNPDEFYNMYMEARKRADAKVLKSNDAEDGQTTILTEMRRLYGLH